MWRNLVLLVLSIAIGAGVTYMMDFSGARPMAEQAPEVKPAYVAKEIVPDFEFQTLDGQKKSIKDLLGKTVVLNFWASWCPPCVMEFPHFLKLAKERPDDVIFLGLSSDFDDSAMNRFLSKMNYEYPDAMAAKNVLIALDEKGAVTRDIFQTYKLPETIIIDPKGRMIGKLVGADWDYKILLDMING